MTLQELFETDDVKITKLPYVEPSEDRKQYERSSGINTGKRGGGGRRRSHTAKNASAQRTDWMRNRGV